MLSDTRRRYQHRGAEGWRALITQQGAPPQIQRIQRPSPAALKRLRTLPALTAWALPHNPQTASASLEAQAAALGYAKGLWLPTLSAQVQGQRSETLYSTHLLNAPAVNGLYSSLSFSELLFNFGFGTLVDRSTRFVILAKVDDSSAEAVLEGFTRRLRILPMVLRKMLI